MKSGSSYVKLVFILKFLLSYGLDDQISKFIKM